MSEHRPDDEDVFAERVARPLRTTVGASDRFEDSLFAAIRAERPLRRTAARRVRPLSPAWWSAPGTVRLSPLASLALAAGIAAITVTATRRLAGAPTSTIASPTVVAVGPVQDTVTFVRFVFVGQARSVAVVGDFNAWGAKPTVLARTANDAWAASVPLTNGRHEYAFIVDGERWIADPFAPSSSDEFDTKSSVITVGT
jgi:hypothetical protein